MERIGKEDLDIIAELHSRLDSFATDLEIVKMRSVPKTTREFYVLMIAVVIAILVCSMIVAYCALKMSKAVALIQRDFVIYGDLHPEQEE